MIFTNDTPNINKIKYFVLQWMINRKEISFDYEQYTLCVKMVMQPRNSIAWPPNDGKFYSVGLTGKTKLSSYI